MAAVNLARFSNFEALRKMHPHLLVELLWPYRSYFGARRYSLRRKNRSPNYAAIATILRSPDEEMPMDLVEGL